MKNSLCIGNTPLGWGLLVFLVWSSILGLYSALYGHLGVTRGIVIGPWIVGSISRYWDPLILGALVALINWSWKKFPSLEYGRSWLVFFVSVAAFFTFIDHFPKQDRDVSLPLFLCLLTLLMPSGLWVTILLVVLFGILIWMIYGIVVFAIWITFFSIGKLVIYLAMSIIRHGFNGAFNEIREKFSTTSSS